MIKKSFLLFLLIFVNIFSSNISHSPEDIEIEKLKQEIKLLQNKIKKLENKKIEKFKEEEKQPKIGLVLSGGGAKGFAHIGVLKVLEQIILRLIILQEQVWELLLVLCTLLDILQIKLKS